MKPLAPILLLSSLLLGPGGVPAVYAVKTEKVDHDTFAEFNNGEFENVSLTSDGHLELAPGLTNLATINDPIIWAAVEDGKGNVFIGTGNQGKVYKINAKGEQSVFFAPNEVMVHALAVDRKGRLYAATSPNGRVYRLDADGRAEVFCNPGETYVWAMTFGKDSALYLATGNHGKILRASTSDSTPVKAETYFESEETHITALAWDKDGSLLAGTSPHGYLYRIDKPKHGFVLFNSGDNEIKQIAVTPEGTIYTSTFAEQAKQKSSSSSGSPSVIILSSGGDGTSGDDAAKADATARTRDAAAEDGGDAAGPAGAGAGGSSNTGTARGGTARGGIFRLDGNGFSELYWTAPDEAIYSMILLRNGDLLVGTGDKGRLYSVSGPNRWKLLQKISDGAQISALLPDTAESKQCYAATSHPARLYRLDFSLAANGTFTSKAFDARQKSFWGKIHPDGETPAGTKLEFSTRCGNTEKPEKTWSDWSAAVPLAAEIAISNLPTRYLQYRVSFSHEPKSPGATAQLRRVQFYYQSQNAAPVISQIKVVAEGFSVSKMMQMPMDVPMNLDQLLGGGRAGNPLAAMKPPLKVTRGPGLCTVVWEASDPNQDQLEYSVAIRGELETSWTTLADKTSDIFFSFDSTGFREGRYFVKVTASDDLSNPPELARTTEKISEAFLIDNTPPVLTVKKQQVEKGRARITVEAADGVSVISSAAYSLDGKDDVSLRPEDLIFDSTTETFAIELNDLTKGPHSLLLRVQDEARNASVLKLNFDSP
jgi:sugar lactone lactonase YvrE